MQQRARSSRARVVQTVVALTVIILIFVVFLPQVVDYGDVWAAIIDMPRLESPDWRAGLPGRTVEAPSATSGSEP